MRACDSLDRRQQVINAAMKAAPEVSVIERASWAGVGWETKRKDVQERVEVEGCLP